MTTTENEVARLMGDAQQQLDEHKLWLKGQMHEWMNTQDGGEWKLQFRVLIEQVDDIKLRMSRVDSDNITIVWEYPDEIITFLKAETTPAHLRKALEGGHVINPEQPGAPN
jgi:hypothetical protein